VNATYHALRRGHGSALRLAQDHPDAASWMLQGLVIPMGYATRPWLTALLSELGWRHQAERVLHATLDMFHQSQSPLARAERLDVLSALDALESPLPKLARPTEPTPSQAPQYAHVGVDDLLLAVACGRLTQRGALRRWGRRATEDQLQRVAQAMATMRDPAHRLALCHVFADAPLHQAPPFLYRWARRHHTPEQRAALAALKGQHSPAHQRLALTLLEQPAYIPGAIELLDPDAGSTLSTAFPLSVQRSEAERPHPTHEPHLVQHWLTMAWRDLLQTQTAPAWEPVADWIYTAAWSPVVRHDAIRWRTHHTTLPPEWLQELPWDVEAQTRALAFHHGRPAQAPSRPPRDTPVQIQGLRAHANGSFGHS